MDEFHRFSDLPEALRRACFAAAWRSSAGGRPRSASGRGSSTRKRLRLVCRDARAAADAVTTSVGVQQTGEEYIAELYACIRAVGSGRFPALREWRVQMCSDPPADDTIIALAQAIPPTLQKLHILEASFGQLAAAALAATAVPALRQLVLRENGMDAAVLQVLVRGFGLRLELLDLSHNPIHPAGAAALAGARLPALRELYLSEMDLHDAGAQALAQAAWPALEVLHLDGNGISREGAVALAAASSRLPALRELSLGNRAVPYPNLNDAAVQALTQVVWGALEVLRLDSNCMGYLSAAALADAGAARLPALRELYLSENRFGDVGFWALLGTFWGALEVLNLDDNNITCSGVTALAHVGEARLPALRRLHLCSNPIGDAGVRALVQRPWPHLRELYLRDNCSYPDGSSGITNFGVRALGAGAWRFPALEILSLKDIKMSFGGMHSLVQQAPWPALQSLDLSCYHARVEEMAALAAASRSQLPALRELTLRSCEMGAASVAALAQGDWRHLEVLNFCSHRWCGSNHRNVSGVVDALAAAGAARFPALCSLTLEQVRMGVDQQAALEAAWPSASITITPQPHAATSRFRALRNAVLPTAAWLLATLLFCAFLMWALGVPAPLLLLMRPKVLALVVLLSLLVGLLLA